MEPGFFFRVSYHSNDEQRLEDVAQAIVNFVGNGNSPARSYKAAMS
jgi:hypothetical protein